MTLSFPQYKDSNHPHFTEFLPIIDTDGKILSVENRVKTHKELLLHPVVRGIILTHNGEIIMQRKRLKSLPKEILDTTVSGHIGGALEEMEALIGQNVAQLIIPGLKREAQEEAGIKLFESELIDLGQAGMYPDMPEKREHTFVYVSRTRERVTELMSEEGITFEAVEIDEILQANRTSRFAWDIIGPPWSHIWKQVQEESRR